MVTVGAGDVSADIEVSYTDARFRDDDPTGADIPGAIPLVVSAGISAVRIPVGSQRTFAPLRPDPLIEDGSWSRTKHDANLRVGKEVGSQWRLPRRVQRAGPRDHDIRLLLCVPLRRAGRRSSTTCTSRCSSRQREVERALIASDGRSVIVAAPCGPGMASPLPQRAAGLHKETLTLYGAAETWRPDDHPDQGVSP